jgi:hypothetical protein
MSKTLRDAFARELDRAGHFDADVEALVARGETRLRHRRLSAVVASGVTVVLVIAAVAGVTAGRPEGRGDVVNHPDHPPAVDSSPRRIVYSDVRFPSTDPSGEGVHFGDDVVKTRNSFVHLDVTDNGFLYTDAGGVWFSDGGTPVELGTHLCGADHAGTFGNFAHRAVMTANSGTLAAWFECPRPSRKTLVVFDTASRREVARRNIADCGGICELYGLTSGYVYFNQGGFAGFPRADYRLDVTTGELTATSAQAYAEDVRGQPRGLIVGGIATDGIGVIFRAVGSRLVPQRDGRYRPVVGTAYDTATGQALRLQAPASHIDDEFTLFEWLDDDTVALIAEADIVMCELATGRCAVAAAWSSRDNREATRRILPGFPLPG